MTCTTPLSVTISATVTCASSIKTPSLFIVTFTVLPLFKVTIAWPLVRDDDNTFGTAT